MNPIDDLLSTGDAALRIIGPHVDEGEVFISRNSYRSISLQKNKIKSVSGGGESGIAIRVLKDGKLGFSYCTGINTVTSALQLALQGASITPKKPFEFPAGKKYFTIPELLDKRVLDLTPEEGTEIVKSLVDSALEVHSDIVATGGGFSFGEEQIVIMNTRGLEVSEHLSYNSASIHSVFSGNNPSSGYEFNSSHCTIKDFEEIGRKSAELAVKGQNPKKIDSRKMPVVFKPEAFAQLMEFITIPALYGIKAEKGETVYSEKIDQKIMHPSISIIDDPSMPNGVNAMKMDDEGIPSACLELVKDGVLKNFFYNVASGFEFGKESTGNGLRGGGQDHTSPVSTSGRNIMIQGNTSAEDTLISEIDHGLLVYDIMGAHTSNPASGDFSVTGSTIFQLEKGEITHPVSQAMISGNLPNYMQNLSGIGNNYRRLSGGLSPIGFYIPSIRIDGVQVTGEL